MREARDVEHAGQDGQHDQDDQRHPLGGRATGFAVGLGGRAQGRLEAIARPHEAELDVAELDLVVVLQHARLVGLAVDEHAVGRPQIVDDEVAVLEGDARVRTGDGAVVDDQIVFGRAPHRHGHALEDQLFARHGWCEPRELHAELRRHGLGAALTGRRLGLRGHGHGRRGAPLGDHGRRLAGRAPGGGGFGRLLGRVGSGGEAVGQGRQALARGTVVVEGQIVVEGLEQGRRGPDVGRLGLALDGEREVADLEGVAVLQGRGPHQAIAVEVEPVAGPRVLDDPGVSLLEDARVGARDVAFRQHQPAGRGAPDGELGALQRAFLNTSLVVNDLQDHAAASLGRTVLKKVPHGSRFIKSLPFVRTRGGARPAGDRWR